MYTVAELTHTRKPTKAFHAILDDQHGTLTKENGQLIFWADDGAMTQVEPTHINFLSVLGECSLTETARVLDTMHGGAARIACTRAH